MVNKHFDTFWLKEASLLELYPLDMLIMFFAVSVDFNHYHPLMTISYFLQKQLLTFHTNFQRKIRKIFQFVI